MDVGLCPSPEDLSEAMHLVESIASSLNDEPGRQCDYDYWDVCVGSNEELLRDFVMRVAPGWPTDDREIETVIRASKFQGWAQRFVKQYLDVTGDVLLWRRRNPTKIMPDDVSARIVAIAQAVREAAEEVNRQLTMALRVGLKVTAGGRRGHVQAHGTDPQKALRFEQYRREFAAIYPATCSKKMSAYRQVAAKHGVDMKTIRRAVNGG